MSGKILPPTYLLLAMLCMIFLYFLIPVSRFIPPFWNLLGIIPLALGLLLDLRADKVFHQVGTTVKPYEESTVLVTGGLYKISRNPMYLGFVLLLLGIAVLFGTVTPFLVVGVFAVAMDRIFISAEERMLAKKFGANWQAYKNRVGRWL